MEKNEKLIPEETSFVTMASILLLYHSNICFVIWMAVACSIETIRIPVFPFFLRMA
jgi:hypothetical protein